MKKTPSLIRLEVNNLLVGLSSCYQKQLASLVTFVRSRKEDRNPTGSDSSSDNTAPSIPSERARQKHLTPEEILQAVQLYKSGLSTYEIAKQFECDRHTITRALTGKGLALRNKPMNSSQEAQAIELYQSGLSIAKVGARMNFGATTVFNMLKRNGIERRPRHYD